VSKRAVDTSTNHVDRSLGDGETVADQATETQQDLLKEQAIQRQKELQEEQQQQEEEQLLQEQQQRQQRQQRIQEEVEQEKARKMASKKERQWKRDNGLMYKGVNTGAKQDDKQGKPSGSGKGIVNAVMGFLGGSGGDDGLIDLPYSPMDAPDPADTQEQGGWDGPMDAPEIGENDDE